MDTDLEVVLLRQRVDNLERIVRELCEQDGDVEFDVPDQPYRAGNGWD